MSAQPERPWTEDERYTLLTEILKNARVPSHHLLNIVREFNVTPNWTDIPLPSGRSLNSCQHAFLNMIHHPPSQSQLHLPRPESYAPTSVPLLPAAATTGPLLAPSPESSVPAKRPYYPPDKSAFAPRAIQPRPSSLGSAPGTLEGGSPMSPGWGELPVSGDRPRKRGRPSKAEAERRKAAAEARGEEWPQPRRASAVKPKNPPTPSAAAGGMSEGSTESPQATNLRTPERQRQESGSGAATGGRGSTATEDDARRASESSNAGEIDSVLGIVRTQPGAERRISTESRTASAPRPLPPASPSDSFFPVSRLAGPSFPTPSAAGTGRSEPRMFSKSPVTSAGERTSQSTARSELPPPSVTHPGEAKT